MAATRSFSIIWRTFVSSSPLRWTYSGNPSIRESARRSKMSSTDTNQQNPNPAEELDKESQP